MLLNVLIAIRQIDLVDLRAKVQNGTHPQAVRRYIRNLVGDHAVVPEWRWISPQSVVFWLLDLQVDEDDRPFFVWLENTYPQTSIVGVWYYGTGKRFPNIAYRKTIHMRFVSKLRDSNGNVIGDRPEPIDDHRWMGQAPREYT